MCRTPPIIGKHGQVIDVVKMAQALALIAAPQIGNQNLRALEKPFFWTKSNIKQTESRYSRYRQYLPLTRLTTVLATVPVAREGIDNVAQQNLWSIWLELLIYNYTAMADKTHKMTCVLPLHCSTILAKLPSKRYYQRNIRRISTQWACATANTENRQ